MVRTLAIRPSKRLLLFVGILSVLIPLLMPRPARAAAGKVRDFAVPTQDSHPGGITLGPDGAVWFTELATNGIGRFQAGRFTTFPLPSGGEPNAIVSGPGGN